MVGSIHLRKRDRILKGMQKRYFQIEHEFGIELPKTVERALKIDDKIGTTFWRDAIKKEMNTDKIALDVKDEGAAKPVAALQIAH